jgi:hypothetical protein
MAQKNFAVSTVATAPSPANSGTTLTVASGHGTRFPSSVPFKLVVSPANAAPDPTNSEVVTVTAVSTDTLTITRASESSTARSIVVGDRVSAGITAGMWDAPVAYQPTAPSSPVVGQLWIDSDAPGPTSSGHVIENEGTPLTQRANINFTGAGVTASDVGGKTVVDIPASAPGSGIAGATVTGTPTGGDLNDLAYNETTGMLWRKNTSDWAPLAFLPQGTMSGTPLHINGLPWGQIPQVENAGWNKTNLAAQVGYSINFAGSTGAGMAQYWFTPKMLTHMYMPFTIATMPVGGNINFGIGPTYVGNPYPLLTVTPSGTLTADGITFSTTIQAGDMVGVVVDPGVASMHVIRSLNVIETRYVSSTNQAKGNIATDFGAVVLIKSSAQLSAGQISMSAHNSVDIP